MNLFSNNIAALEKALDYSSLKNKVISQNIANSDVPNYKSQHVSFKTILADTTANSITSHITDPRHFSFQSQIGDSAVSTNRNVQYHHNGNNVDMDKEMTDAANQIYYNVLVERLNGKFSTLQNVIKGGR